MYIETKRKIKFIIAILCCIIFVSCTTELTSLIDTYLYELICKLKNPMMTILFRIITEFGNIFAFLSITAVAVLLLKKRRYIILILGNLGFIILFNQGLKLLFSRPRPIHLALIKETGYSFPSGHAMASMAFYGFLIYILWQTKVKRSVKIGMTALLWLLILLIGISRIYLGVHYASDVIAGFSLSVVYLMIMTKLSAKYL